MKLRSLIFLTVILLSATVQVLAQKRVLIQGSISNPGSEKIILTGKNLIDNKDYHLAEVQVDSSGYFIMVVDCAKPILAALKFKAQTLPLFLEPGDSLWLRADGNKLRNTAKFEGKGSKTNKFFLDYHKKYFNDGTLANVIMKAQRERHANGFMWTTDSLKASMLNFYIDYYPESMNNAFDKWIQDEIRANMAWAKWDYLLYQFPFDMSINSFDIDSSDFRIGDEIRILDPTALSSPAYAGFITHYFIELKRQLAQMTVHVKKGEDPVPDIAGIFEFFKDELDINKDLQFTTTARFLAKCAASNLDPAALQLQLAYFKALQPDSSFYSPIDRIIQEKKIHYLKDLNISDTLARKFKPEIFEGKIVYVKYWASWNKASMQELIQCLALEERMKNSGYSFIYVNLDPDITVWYNFLAERNLKGNHYRYEDMEPEGLWDMYLKFKYSSHNQIYAKDGRLIDIWAPPASAGAEKRLKEIK